MSNKAELLTSGLAVHWMKRYEAVKKELTDANAVVELVRGRYDRHIKTCPCKTCIALREYDKRQGGDGE